MSPSQWFRSRFRPVVGLAIVSMVTFTGAIWFWLVEGFGLVDAIYQSIITVSTVGFSEVEPLDTSGRLFTSVLIVAGVGAMVYALGSFAELMIDSSIRSLSARRKGRSLDRMSGHTVVCGYGRSGQAVVRLLPDDTQLGIIDLNSEHEESAFDGPPSLANVVWIEGDCTHDEVLLAAGIDRAAAMIVCLESDSDAMSATLSARVLNSELTIVSRVSDASSAKKLRLAGANHVVSAIEMGARRMVADAAHPSVGSFLDALSDTQESPEIRAITVQHTEADEGRDSLEEQSGARIIGVVTGKGVVTAETALAVGQAIVAIGDFDQLAKLETLVARSEP